MQEWLIAMSACGTKLLKQPFLFVKFMHTIFFFWKLIWYHLSIIAHNNVPRTSQKFHLSYINLQHL